VPHTQVTHLGLRLRRCALALRHDTIPEYPCQAILLDEQVMRAADTIFGKGLLLWCSTVYFGPGRKWAQVQQATQHGAVQFAAHVLGLLPMLASLGGGRTSRTT